MQLVAASLLIGFAFVLLGADHIFQYYGLAAFGGMVIAFVGIRVTRTGLVRETECCTHPVEFGEIPIGFVIMIVGAIVLISSLHKYRRVA